jgi:hypothetical protein
MGNTIETELETLFKKHGIEKATVIIEIKPIDETGHGQSSIITLAPTLAEETEMGKAYEKLSEVIGNLGPEAINAAADVITYVLDQQKTIKETYIKQSSWTQIAHKFAEDNLSPEDYDKLMESVELKNAAAQAQEWETAARWREIEIEYLKAVMDAININPTERD